MLARFLIGLLLPESDAVRDDSMWPTWLVVLLILLVIGGAAGGYYYFWSLKQ